jgi:hypothetical protein
MNRFYLAIVSLLNPLWVRLGVNVLQLHAILQAKLIMDDRRPNAYTQMQQKKRKEMKNGSVVMLLVSLLMGLFYLYFFFVSSDHLMQMFMWFTVYMVMMTITLISDFTNVLIDVKDNYVILPRPVNDRTVVVSRLLHIMIHISKIVLPLALPAFIFLIVRDGFVAALWFGILVLLLSVFGIFVVNTIYIVALKLTTPERFKEVINYVQIIFSVIVFATYYLVPRLLQKSQFEGINLHDYPWLDVVPTYWFAGAWQAVADGLYSVPHVAYLILVWIVPFGSLWLVIRVFAPSFNRKLAMIGSSGGEGAAPVKITAVKKPKFYKQLAKRFTSGTQEELSFELVWLMTGRMRDFKLKVYPSLAYVFVFFAYFLLTGKHGSPGEAWNKLPETNMFIFLIYISSFVFLTAISNLSYSDKYKAAWVYYAAPLASPGPLLMGAFKATLMKFFLPFYLVVMAFTLYMWGPKTLPDLALGFVNVALINLLFALLFLRKLPFSSELNIKQTAGTFLRGLMVLIIPGLIGLGHYIVAGEMWLVGIFALLSAAAFYLLYAKYRETPWAKLDV